MITKHYLNYSNNYSDFKIYIIFVRLHQSPHEADSSADRDVSLIRASLTQMVIRVIRFRVYTLINFN